MASPTVENAAVYDLPADHPGVSDLAYRARRAAIAEVGRRYRRGEPIPDERLRAQPTATRTVEEQEAADKLGRASNASNPDLRSRPR